MTDAPETQSDAKYDSSCCKVTRIAAKYDVLDYAETAPWNSHNYGYPTEFDRYLAARYHGDSTSNHTGDSLRDLDAHFNALVTEAAITTADEPSSQQVVKYRPRDVYEILSNKREVGEQTRREIASSLETIGIDTDDLRADYTSYRSIQTHLKEHMEVDTSRSPTTREVARKTLLSKVNRIEAITPQMLASLQKNGRLADIGEDITVPSTPDDMRITVDVTVENTKTGDVVNVERLLADEEPDEKD
ncbi:rod-determining factor RdfA [Halovenus sp. HT40]|uniref:rod-determining factor RdfA n=1 Tax=Halovenus sp. HT40 TaxID=3126691 RepID=UPI00300F46D9